MLAAAQSHPAIGDGLAGPYLQLFADGGGRRLVLTADPIRDDPGAIGEMVARAPAVERQRCAVMAQQIGIQRLELGQRFEPGDGRVRPSRSYGRRAERQHCQRAGGDGSL